MPEVSSEVCAAAIGAFVWIGGIGIGMVKYMLQLRDATNRLETVVSGCQAALIRAEKFESEMRKEIKNIWTTHGEWNDRYADKLDQHISDDNHNFRTIQASVAEVKDLILRPTQ